MDVLWYYFKRICKRSRTCWVDGWDVIFFTVCIVEDNSAGAVDISLQLLLTCLAICGGEGLLLQC